MKIVIGGSPCTYWSIAQSKNREVNPFGTGWDLFENYLISLDKFNADYFLYENNKSISDDIKREITNTLGVSPICINSSLVSAQNRERLYWTNIPNIQLPKDRHIYLENIIETNYNDTNIFKFLSNNEMKYMVRETKSGRNHFDFGYYHNSKENKSKCVTANTYRGVPYNVLVCPYLRIYNNLPHYNVLNNNIYIDGEKYRINLEDGDYIFRKLTVTECMKLQTVPLWYKFPVSDTQAYKMLGNGWTCDIISEIMSQIKNIKSVELEVLSMYDGMSCGYIALKNLSCIIKKYFATEIDKYAIKTSKYNFADIINLGNAYNIRDGVHFDIF